MFLLYKKTQKKTKKTPSLMHFVILNNNLTIIDFINWFWFDIDLIEIGKKKKKKKKKKISLAFMQSKVFFVVLLLKIDI